MALIITTPPTAEPVQVSDVMARLRLTSTADNARIGQLITAAREYAEKVHRRSLVTKTYTLYLDHFPRFSVNYPTAAYDPPTNAIELPFPPLISVESIQYLDPDTLTLDTWDSSEYIVSPPGLNTPATIEPVPGNCYPSTPRVRAAVAVQFQAGYGYSTTSTNNGTTTTTQVTPPLPQSLFEGICQLAIHLYEHPEAITADGLKISPFSFKDFFGGGRVQVF